MAKKKATKKIKRLKKKAKEARAARLKLEIQVRKLKKKLAARKQQIADIEGRLDQTPAITPEKRPSTADFGDRNETGVASGHRAAWKRHRYLRDRYEFHLAGGATKDSARHLANEDLKQAHGADCGYTEEELGAILS